MFKQLDALSRKPKPFCQYTAPLLWSSPHIAKKMLSYHLSPDVGLASRPTCEIDWIVSWLDGQIGLKNKQVCDLGCGPGLYTSKFTNLGADVIGLDISPLSISYAREQARQTDLHIEYQEANYLEADLPGDNDLITLIYGDFCALSTQQRKHLLKKVHASLKPGGVLMLDVFTHLQFADRSESLTFEPNLTDGFWSPEPYFGFQKNWIYSDLHLTLDHYLIVTPERSFEIYNWLQFFSPTELIRELTGSGFAEVSLFSLLDGAKLKKAPPPRGEMAALARKPIAEPL